MKQTLIKPSLRIDTSIDNYTSIDYYIIIPRVAIIAAEMMSPAACTLNFPMGYL